MRKNTKGTCPHCNVVVYFSESTIGHGGKSHGVMDPLMFRTMSDFKLEVCSAGCPNCGQPVIQALRLIWPGGLNTPTKLQHLNQLLWPDSSNRVVPPEVEQDSPNLANDFREAASVFPKSKKASAALSRRCLQFILNNKGGTKASDLSKQIDEVLEQLPSELAQNVDAIRNIGNFAAHPKKSTHSGEIVDVEDEEAEWLLDVLEQLLDYYYVAPIRAAEKRDALNTKLKDIGKPPLKNPQNKADT